MRAVFRVMLLSIVGVGCFGLGTWYSRERLRSFSEELSQHPTNSFTKCLHDSWAESGELQASGKKWILVP